MKTKHLIIFGTRPEAIKMAPLVKELYKETSFDVRVCVTAQHRTMLDQVLDFFEISPDYDLDLMKYDQNLTSLTSDIINSLKKVFDEFKPDFAYVHGDTTTSMAASLAAFYAGVKVCHVEAGLRTFNKWAPFPEEMNRQITGRIADYHFAPTERSKKNLLGENINISQILVTGNTVIDALLDSTKRVESVINEEIVSVKSKINLVKKIILVTGHRRENHGEGFLNICKALREIAIKYTDDVEIVYPVHLNPKVQEPVYEILSDIENVKLITPLAYPAFVWLMDQAFLIITDSGGVQEEAPSLGKPVLVMRDTTERPEAVEAGTVILVGTNKDKIVNETSKLLDDYEFYKEMSTRHNPYGDGKACKRIVDFMRNVTP